MSYKFISLLFYKLMSCERYWWWWVTLHKMMIIILIFFHELSTQLEKLTQYKRDGDGLWLKTKMIRYYFFIFDELTFLTIIGCSCLFCCKKKKINSKIFPLQQHSIHHHITLTYQTRVTNTTWALTNFYDLLDFIIHHVFKFLKLSSLFFVWVTKI